MIVLVNGCVDCIGYKRKERTSIKPVFFHMVITNSYCESGYVCSFVEY